ncbi:MAG: MarR family winged helix-turn-helix transcriptional regulator [Jatrophihabitantaceae bacterium]
MASSQCAGTVDARGLTDVISRLRRALRRSIRTDYPWELRPVAQVEVLQSLGEGGVTRVGDLAERLCLAQSTVSALVGQLVSAGLVTRDVDPADRRAAIVALSSAGRTDLRNWDTAHRRRLRAALARLSPTDQRAVLAAVPALGRLVDALD